ncbi:putative glycerol: H+ symporter [Sarocladium strictum]
MGALTFIRSVYDLDTLDTRFTNSSSVPYQTIVDARSDPAVSQESSAKAQIRSQPSKWRTPEFYVYYLVFLVAVPWMFWVPYSVSRSSDPRYHKFEKHLSDGWIPGRKIDISDMQYHTFRGNLPYTAALLVFHPLLRKLWNAVFPITTTGRRDAGSKRMDQRISFDYTFALIFLVALHGVSAAKVLGILYVNYQIATKLPRRHVPVATWVWNVGILFANELCEGYRFGSIARHISPPLVTDKGLRDSVLMQWGYWLDSYGGIMSRWEVLFNITILRLISFNLDYYWSIDQQKSSDPVEKKQLDPANLSERDRVKISSDVKDFSFRNYVAYAIYAPLYLVGPILTFNDYICQSKYRVASIETHRTIRYAVRFLLVLLAMEVILHYDYVGAISKAAPVWNDYTPAQLAMLSFMNLHIIWLKLLLPWRLFRLWALIDGMDPPENMVRCVSNNYSMQLFWRAWHRSYNRWLIRYIYVPLGGSSFRGWRATVRSVATFLMVFTFVALWHDIQLRLLIWGWLIVLFMLPEWTATWAFPKRKWESRPTEYRILCGVGAVISILMMITANLVGFAFGLDGLETILRAILHDWSGTVFIVTTCLCLFVGVQVMFEVREDEKRKGATLKC